MKKILCLCIACIWMFLLKAQSIVAPNFDQTNYPQFSINISVLGKSTISADNYFDEAERYVKVGDYKAAINLFNKAASSYLLTKKYTRYGTTIIKLSNANLLSKNYLNAEQLILKLALPLFNRNGSKSGQMASYQQLAKVYAASNRLTQSLWFYTQQGIIAQQIHDKTSHIESVLGMANLKIRNKDYDLALKDLTLAENLCKISKIFQYNQEIKANRDLIAEQTNKG